MSVYLERYASPSLKIADKVHPNTGVIVVIPVFNEPDVLPSLISLKNSHLPEEHVEVLVVINEAEQCSESITHRNDLTFKLVKDWIKENPARGISFFVSKTVLPKKHAGVGLARKAGMDEAIRRFETIENEKGIVLCYDADCTCSPSYLSEIHRAFKEKDLLGASIYYEHLTEDLSETEKEGILQYELHLRYYVNALRKAGYPYAFHTVGSSMAVRADVYKKAGGMNKRKAGEDFHFLHKVIPYGSFEEINSATVYPSARVSDRVPFGTGKAMGQWLENKEQDLLSYNPKIFRLFETLLKLVPSYYRNNEAGKLTSSLPQVVQEFLKKENYSNAIQEINRQSGNLETFVHRWFLWFNGLRALHFVHYVRDHQYPSIPVKEAAAQLIDSDQTNVEHLIGLYRNLDKVFKPDQIDQKHLYSGYQ